MIDVHFYMRAAELKKELMAGGKRSRAELFEALEACRREDPVVYNIETTNACNMRCEMCPRTTMMTRPVETMDQPTFERIADQLAPWSDEEWSSWASFAESHYGVPSDVPSENNFFLYVIPRVVVLHGYGDPLLDKRIVQRVAAMTERGIPSYFSCNPANINLDRTEEAFAAGLGYVKFSVESADDLRHKSVRGEASNFTDAYERILALLERKAKHGYDTTIVITMLNLGKSWQQEEYDRVSEAFAGKDVYLYLKSQDQKWYQDGGVPTESIHWIEFCQFPWSSMTIKSNGESVQCVEDFNNEIILGDARQESLKGIWNGAAYRQFREDHFDLRPGIKCTEQCDMKLIGSFLSDASDPVE